VDDLHPTGSQGVEFGVVEIGSIVNHNGELGTQLAEQPGDVEAPRVSDNLDDASVSDLEAVAERTMNYVASPMLSQAVDVRELVNQTGGGENPTSDYGVTAGEFDAEEVVVGSGDTIYQRGQDLSAVAADLLLTSGRQVRWRLTFTTEEAVHVCGRSIAWLAGVDDDHGPALAPEL
jgi:hypothetical protein